ncbi:MAG: hypothetical protein JWM40_1861 [Frankiales bacterium]|nr:hypothetical protein [Frankiales bacterium]
MDVDQRAGSWTLDDVFELPDSINRYEVIDGNLIVTPPPSIRHQHVGSVLLGQLMAATPQEWTAMYESYLDYGGDGRVPDLLVVRSSVLRDTTRKAFVPGEVGLAVEIVSPSSRRTDRLAKPAEYADQGIDLMWRVELEPDLVVHPFRRTGTGWLAEPELRGIGVAPVPWGRLSLDLTSLL